MSELETRIRELAPEQRRRLRERLDAKRGGTTMAITPVARDRTDFPISYAQERLWFLDQLAPGNAFYNLSFAQRISVAVSPPALEEALSDLVHRHEALRTAFPVVDGEPVQRIVEARAVSCPVVELPPLTPAACESEIRRLAGELAMIPFDLSVAPLFRARLVRLGVFDWAFLFVIHHIVADGWSLEVLFRDLGKLYTDRVAGRSPAPGGPKVQYVDFALWQRGQLEGELLERQLDYWRRALEDLPTLDLPTDRPRPRFQQYRGGQVELTIPSDIVTSLCALGSAAGATPFMVLLAAFYVLLQRYCRQHDLVVGTPIANRGRAELEDVVGFFANTLVLRGDLSGDPSFRELLARVRAMALDGYSRQDLPFSRLVAALRPEQDLSRNPLFQVSFQLVSIARVERSASGAVDWDKSLVFDRSTAIFDLTLNLWDTGAGIHGIFEYSSDLFDRSTIQAMAEHYRNLLDGVIASPDEPIGRLSVLSDEERRRLLVDWNDTLTESPDDVHLHTLFERQAARTPEAAALRHGEETVSYAALAERARRLAAELVAIDPAGRRHVGLLTEPSFDMVAAVLAILQSGNAYVPLDISAPGERLDAMLEDASIELVVTSQELAPRLAARGVRCLLLDGGPSANEAADACPVAATSPGDCAYVIFTSGSTGRPKGVMVSHRSAVNYLRWCERTYLSGAGVGAPLTSPISSDMSLTSLFLPLVTGKAMHFLEGDDPIEALDRALRDGPEFSFVKVTPSHLVALRNLSSGRGAPTGTHAFIVGGEALRGEDLEPWRESAPEIPFYNEYGPTEATVGCCVHELRAGEVEAGPVPIGRPIANSRLYVLDAGMPVGVGMSGELHIGGAGVAIGYASTPSATASSFVPDHLSGEPGARLYRTGDLVRFRSDGALEFLGRLDRQLKIRGYRIEPGDVETTLRQHAGVADAVVLASDYGGHDRRLVAYTVPANGIDTTTLVEELGSALRSKLPAHMIPARITPIETIPRTSSGKTDTRALAELDGAVRATRRPAVSEPPRTPLEEVVARIFTDVLKTDGIGVHDGFFAHLGGDSLLATRAVSRLRELLQVELPLRTLFEAPTVETLVAALSTDREVAARLEGTATVLLEILEMSEGQVEEELTAADGPGDDAQEGRPCE